MRPGSLIYMHFITKLEQRITRELLNHKSVILTFMQKRDWCPPYVVFISLGYNVTY